MNRWWDFCLSFFWRLKKIWSTKFWHEKTLRLPFSIRFCVQQNSQTCSSFFRFCSPPPKELIGTSTSPRNAGKFDKQTERQQKTAAEQPDRNDMKIMSDELRKVLRDVGEATGSFFGPGRIGLGKLVGLAGWVVGWLVGWLVGCFLNNSIFSKNGSKIVEVGRFCYL